MILGSHNSWSYLQVKKWWMIPLKFTAKCQSKSIAEQHIIYDVECFDLRVRFKNNNLVIAHGLIEYKYSKSDLFKDLTYLNERKAIVRILHETRNKKQYTEESINNFVDLCIELQCKFPNIRFWCGRNLYNWNVDYEFSYKPSCKEYYSSVCSPKLIDDWYPRLFAKRNNSRILKENIKEEILLIDFVQYGN